LTSVKFGIWNVVFAGMGNLLDYTLMYKAVPSGINPTTGESIKFIKNKL